MRKRVLIVAQEMDPYTDLSAMAVTVNKLAPYLLDKGMEIRVLMPKFGTINERRHRLHEVVRLSGMNIIVDDDDYPLIIKVASMPTARLQVYFLDNDDFFKRKAVFEDPESGEPYEDNVDRMVFFCKGVLETVKKFGWSPDIVHCHGWMTGLLPLYIKTAYKNDPLFENAKVVFSSYKTRDYAAFFGDNFASKASINHLSEEHLLPFMKDGDGVNFEKGVLHYADGLVRGEDEESETLLKLLDTYEKPVLPTVAEEVVCSEILDFYHALSPEEVEN